MYFGLMIVIFVLGYAAIALEHPLKINKSATALLLAAVIWAVYALMGPGIEHENLIEHLGDTAEILFFLLGAMTIVEIIDRHDGFSIITDRITTTNKRKLLWIVSILTFFMSAVLDNLTTSIVMCALLRKLIADKQTRWFFCGMVILGANAGGAWSPIGDVTTIMLWIGGQVSASKIIMETFIPSLISMLVPLAAITLTMKGNVERPATSETNATYSVSKKQSLLTLIMGVGLLLFVPIFKTITHLPPYLGILFGLGVMWVTTEIMHRNSPVNYSKLSVNTIIQRVDTPSVLFFLGILMAVQCLNEAGHRKPLRNQPYHRSVILNYRQRSFGGSLNGYVSYCRCSTSACRPFITFLCSRRSILGRLGILCRNRRQLAHHRFGSRCCSNGNGENRLYLVLEENNTLGIARIPFGSRHILSALSFRSTRIVA